MVRMMLLVVGAALFGTSSVRADSYTDNSNVQFIQHILYERGWDVGLPDGLIGPKTRAGIMAVQRANNLPEQATSLNRSTPWSAAGDSLRVGNGVPSVSRLMVLVGQSGVAVHDYRLTMMLNMVVGNALATQTHASPWRSSTKVVDTK